MAVEIYEWCPFCIEGSVFNENRGCLEPCPVCSGYAVLTPKDICNCGRPCLLEKEGIPYCGLDPCLIALRNKRTWEMADLRRDAEDEDSLDFTEGNTDFPAEFWMERYSRMH